MTPPADVDDIVRDALDGLGAGADAAWAAPDPSLIAAEPIPPPLVPPNVLPPQWAQWTADAAEGAGAPHAFVAVTLLSVAGALIGNSRWASPWYPWREPPAINAAPCSCLTSTLAILEAKSWS